MKPILAFAIVHQCFLKCFSQTVAESTDCCSPQTESPFITVPSRSQTHQLSKLSTQFSSVQFKMVSMRSGRPICAPPRLSGVSPKLSTVCHKVTNLIIYQLSLFLYLSQNHQLSQFIHCHRITGCHCSYSYIVTESPIVVTRLSQNRQFLYLPDCHRITKFYFYFQFQ